ncbi:MAG: glycosyltransferase family 39 protein [Anaerolineae bacterium]|nr:MAG: glycosyltransferase family 39 protein [Anaerolineae bacterium]
MRARPIVAPLALVLAASLAVRALAALPMRQPGFMDAHYTYVGALNLVEGRGFNDPYIWNYLDDPAGVPHPSHLYWMPLPSLVAWAGMALLGPSYRAGQVGFILLSSLLPLVSYFIARRISDQRRHALLAGLVTVFSGFYLRFWVSPEGATPFALAGSLTLLALGLALESNRAVWFAVAGAAAGLAYLSRSDALLFLLIALPMPWLITPRASRITHHASRIAYCVLRLVLFLVAFFAVTGPWFYRNWVATGAPLAGGGLQTLWLRTYDELYSYGRVLTPETYLAWGWGNILRSKLRIAADNLMTVVAVDGLIFAFPLALVGLWSLRRRRLYWPFLLYAPLLWLTMTVAFTYPGWRGGLLHSSAAWLPFLFPAAMIGLDRSIAWATRHRHTWDVRQASRVFGVGVVLLAAMLSGVVYWQRVLGGSLTDPAWNKSDLVYGDVGAWLEERAAPTDLVMINNPPSFFYHTGRSSIVVPAEDPETLVEVCDRYGVRFVVLDHNIVPALVPLYQGWAVHPRLVERARLEGSERRPVIIYELLGVWP